MFFSHLAISVPLIFPSVVPGVSIKTYGCIVGGCGNLAACIFPGDATKESLISTFADWTVAMLRNFFGR